MTLLIKTLTTLSIIFLALTSTSYAETPPLKTATEMVAANPALEGRLIEVEVNGMVCDFCAQSLTKVLEKKESVEKVSISLETKLMIITQKEGKVLTDAEVHEAVNWAGYDIASIKRV